MNMNGWGIPCFKKTRSTENHIKQTHCMVQIWVNHRLNHLKHGFSGWCSKTCGEGSLNVYQLQLNNFKGGLEWVMSPESPFSFSWQILAKTSISVYKTGETTLKYLELSLLVSGWEHFMTYRLYIDLYHDMPYIIIHDLNIFSSNWAILYGYNPLRISGMHSQSRRPLERLTDWSMPSRVSSSGARQALGMWNR